MAERNEIGKISFEMNKKELEQISNSGKLGVFVEKATELFRRDLKAELVNSISSGSISLGCVNGEDDFGYIGPIGPLPHIITELDTLTNKLKEIEVLVKLNR